MKPDPMITADVRCWGVASQIRNGCPGRPCVPQAGHRMDRPAL